MKHGTYIHTLARRPQLNLDELLQLNDKCRKFVEKLGKRRNEIVESVEISLKYQGYINREKSLADKIKRLNDLKIPQDIVFEELKSISTEGRQKLSKLRPETIGKASRISGVSPSDVSVLLMYLGK